MEEGEGGRREEIRWDGWRWEEESRRVTRDRTGVRGEKGSRGREEGGQDGEAWSEATIRNNIDAFAFLS
jgi:hypothetical protein